MGCAWAPLVVHDCVHFVFQKLQMDTVCVDRLTLDFVLRLRNVAVLWELETILLYERALLQTLVCCKLETASTSQ